MHFTYKNLDDARRDDVIDSEKLTRIPEDIMPKKDQENSIEKKMDSIDHDDKKCEMVNEQLLCRKKENSHMLQFWELFRYFYAQIMKIIVKLGA